MRVLPPLVLGSLVLLLGFGCAGKVESSGSAGVSGDSCDALCAKCAAGTATCASQCKQQLQGKCGSLYDAFAKCAVENACASLPCQSKMDAYSQCMVGGKGGSGGAGGTGGWGGGGTGGGYGGTGGTVTSLCDTACAKCGSGQPSCVPQCKQGMQGTCGDLYSAVVACVVDKQCDASLCQPETNAYATCINSGTGGYGGGYGGSGGGWGGAGAYAGSAGAGGASCEAADPQDVCSVCAAAKCCAEWIACEEDTGPYVKCADVYACAAWCDAGTFEDCLQLCSPDYNPKVNDFYACVWIDKCATECQ